MEPPVYLDYAATSAVRPEAVVDAVAAYLRDIGATPGRAGHRRALDAGRVMLRCRRVLAELLCIPGDPGRIAFQFNATHALNTAIFGLLRPGDRVVRTAYDHNSVRRPIAALLSRGVQETVLAGSPGGEIDLAEAERALLGTGMAARRPTFWARYSRSRSWRSSPVPRVRSSSWTPRRRSGIFRWMQLDSAWICSRSQDTRGCSARREPEGSG
jgi:hypothetical protein